MTSAPTATARPGTAARAAQLVRDLLPYLGLMLVTYFSLASEYFLELYNLQRIATDSTTLIIVAIGMTLVILLGEIDLSVGAVTALLSVLIAQMMTAGIPWPLAVAATLALSSVIGLVNGVLTVVGRIHSLAC